MPSGPLMNDMLESRLEPADKQELDLSNAPILRRRVSPVDRSLTRDQAAAFQAGALNVPIPGSEVPDLMIPPNDAYSDLPPGTPLSTAPHAAPQVQPLPQMPLPAPPLNPNDTEPVKKRINKLYGQWKGAEERATSFEERALQAEAQLAHLRANPSPPPPAPAPQPRWQPNPGAAYGEEGSSPPADYVSLAELQNLIFGQTRFFMEQQRIQRAQEAARAEAEADFPDVFANPDLREQYNLVLQRDQYLQQDPQGPYKAAALARGLNHSPAIPSGGFVPPTARKVQAQGLGATIPSGPQVPLNDRQQLYAAALNRARQTGDLADFARARRIQMGLPG